MSVLLSEKETFQNAAFPVDKSEGRVTNLYLEDSPDDNQDGDFKTVVSAPAPDGIGTDAANEGEIPHKAKPIEDNVTLLNCTWSDLTKPGAREKHQDAARRAYQYFKDQTYSGGQTIMVMVDSSAEANTEMQELAAADNNFFYFHLDERNNVPEHISKAYPEAAKSIKPCSFFETPRFAKKLAWIKQAVDPYAESPLANTRPPLGSKRNFGMAVGDKVFEDRGRKNDVVFYIDDDIYGENYVADGVANLQDGNVFTAECSYYVALPQADLENPGELTVQNGTYEFEKRKDVTWLDTLGHRKEVGENETISDMPFGFTYAVRREAVKAVGGVMDILRGEDRSVLVPLIKEFGEQAINIRTEITGNIIRLLGDNNSSNAVSKLGITLPDVLQTAVDQVFNVWKPMLENKFKDELTPGWNSNVVDMQPSIAEHRLG